MVGIFILAVIALVTAGIASYAVYSSVKSTEMLTLVQRNGAQMDGIISTVKAEIRRLQVPNGSGGYSDVIFVPTPDVDVPLAPTMSFVPSWINGNLRTPWGSAYGYCAYAPTAITGALASGAAPTPVPYSSSLGADDVSTRALTAPDLTAQSYVVAGARLPNINDDAGAPAVMAFVLAPSVNSDSMPSCDSVYWKNGSFRAPGGMVQAVTDDAGTLAGIAVPPVMTRYISTVGGGDGLVACSAVSTDPTYHDCELLADALAEWKVTMPPVAVFNLLGGAHQLAGSSLDLTVAAARASGRTLRIVGAGSGSTSIANSGTAGDLKSDANLVVEGLKIGPNIGLRLQPGSSLQAYGAILPYTYVTGADVLMGQGTTLVAATSDTTSTPEASLIVRGGHVTLFDSAAKAVGGPFVYGISMSGGVMDLNVGGLAVTGSSNWVKLTGGAHVGGYSSLSPITFNSTTVVNPFDVPATPWSGIANIASPTGTIEPATGSPVTCPSTASCAAPCATNDFLVSGNCTAADSGATPAWDMFVRQSGATIGGSGLPTGWSCKFEAAAGSTVPGSVTSWGTASAVCARLQIQ